MKENSEKVVTLNDVFSNMRRDRKMVGIIVVVILILSIVSALKKDNLYQSDAILASNGSLDGGSAILSGSLGRFASLAGFNVNGFDADTQQYIAMFDSGDFLIPFIKENNIKREIYKDSFDEATNSWKGPSPLRKFLRNLKRTIFPSSETKKVPLEPSDVDAFEIFKKKFLSVSVERRSRLITVSVKAYSPEHAFIYTREIIKAINKFTKDQKLSEANKTIKFLTEEINNTSSVEVKMASSKLIEAQMKTIMLANTREDFAFKVIDSPRISERKVAPNRKTIVLLGLFFGFVLSFLVVAAKTLRE